MIIIYFESSPGKVNEKHCTHYLLVPSLKSGTAQQPSYRRNLPERKKKVKLVFIEEDSSESKLQ